MVRGVTRGAGAIRSPRGYPDLSLPLFIKNLGRHVFLCVFFFFIYGCVLIHASYVFLCAQKDVVESKSEAEKRREEKKNREL